MKEKYRRVGMVVLGFLLAPFSAALVFKLGVVFSYLYQQHALTADVGAKLLEVGWALVFVLYVVMLVLGVPSMLLVKLLVGWSWKSCTIGAVGMMVLLWLWLVGVGGIDEPGMEFFVDGGVVASLFVASVFYGWVFWLFVKRKGSRTKG